MVFLARLAILLAVVSLILGTVSRYLEIDLLPIGAPLTWLRLAGVLLLFALALLLDQVLTHLQTKD